jgi:hypothetical protein
MHGVRQYLKVTPFRYNSNLSYQASHAPIVVYKNNNGVGFKWAIDNINSRFECALYIVNLRV